MAIPGLGRVLSDFPEGTVVLDGRDEVWILLRERLWRNMQGFRISSDSLANRQNPISGGVVVLWMPREGMSKNRRGMIAEASTRLASFPPSSPVRVTIETWAKGPDGEFWHVPFTLTDGDIP